MISYTTNAFKYPKRAKVTFGKFGMVVAAVGRLSIRAKLHINQLPHVVMNISAMPVSILLHCCLSLEQLASELGMNLITSVEHSVNSFVLAGAGNV